MRARILDYVAKHPGTPARGIYRAPGLVGRSLKPVLDDLVAQGALVRVPRGRSHAYFRSAADLEAWRGAPDANLARLAKYLESHPGATQGDVVRHAARYWGWPRSTTQHRLRRMKE